MSKTHAAITAVAHYVPERVLSNADLEQIVDTNDQWIKERTGISTRRILGKGLGSSDMGAWAVQRLLEKRGLSPMDIDILIVATVTPDMIFPATANIICDKIGAKRAWGFDIEAACSGFLYTVSTASAFIEAGRAKRVVVVGSDKMTAVVDYEDRNNCILFGDAAAAILLEPNDEGYGLIDYVHYTDGSGRQLLRQEGGGSVMPPSLQSVREKKHYIYQEGKQVFKAAVTNMANAAAEVMARNNLSGDTVQWLVPHQANMRIIEATRQRMGLPAEQVMINIHRYGNTTGATIPMCLSEWEPQLKRGDNLVLAAFGGGFTWGASYVRWAYDGQA